VETIFHIMKTQLFALLPAMSFAYLASTNATMLKSLSPLISTIYHYSFLFFSCNFLLFSHVNALPTMYCNDFEFTYHKPTFYTDVDAIPLPKDALVLHFDNGIMKEGEVKSREGVVEGELKYVA
jgi:hypothetical protein